MRICIDCCYLMNEYICNQPTVTIFHGDECAVCGKVENTIYSINESELLLSEAWIVLARSKVKEGD